MGKMILSIAFALSAFAAHAQEATTTVTQTFSGIHTEDAKALCRTVIEQAEKAAGNQPVNEDELIKQSRECIEILKEARRLSLSLGGDKLPLVYGRFLPGGEVNLPFMGGKALGSGRLAAGVGGALVTGQGGVLGVKQPVVIPFVTVAPVAVGTNKGLARGVSALRKGHFVIIGNPNSTYDISGWYFGGGYEKTKPEVSATGRMINQNYTVYANVANAFDLKGTILVTKFDSSAGQQEATMRVEALRIETDLSAMGSGFTVGDVLRLALGETLHGWLVDVLAGTPTVIVDYFTTPKK